MSALFCEREIGDVVATLIGSLLTSALWSERDVVGAVVLVARKRNWVQKRVYLEGKNALLENKIA